MSTATGLDGEHRMKTDREYYQRFLLDQDAWKPLFPHDLDKLNLQSPEDIRQDQKERTDNHEKRYRRRRKK